MSEFLLLFENIKYMYVYKKGKNKYSLTMNAGSIECGGWGSNPLMNNQVLSPVIILVKNRIAM